MESGHYIACREACTGTKTRVCVQLQVNVVQTDVKSVCVIRQAVTYSSG